MGKDLLTRLLVCIFILGGFFYAYIDRQNDLTELKIEIPKLAESLHQLEEENTHLLLEVQRLENPDQLIHFLRQKEYSHLKSPYIDEIIKVHRR